MHEPIAGYACNVNGENAFTERVTQNSSVHSSDSNPEGTFPSNLMTVYFFTRQAEFIAFGLDFFCPCAFRPPIPVAAKFRDRKILRQHNQCKNEQLKCIVPMKQKNVYRSKTVSTQLPTQKSPSWKSGGQIFSQRNMYYIISQILAEVCHHSNAPIIFIIITRAEIFRGKASLEKVGFSRNIFAWVILNHIY